MVEITHRYGFVFIRGLSPITAQWIRERTPEYRNVDTIEPHGLYDYRGLYTDRIESGGGAFAGAAQLIKREVERIRDLCSEQDAIMFVVMDTDEEDIVFEQAHAPRRVLQLEEAVRPRRIWIEVMRWVAMLPAAFLGAIVVYWIAKLIMWLSDRFGDEGLFGEDSMVYYVWRELFSSTASGAAFVFCGTLTAPRGRVVVAIVLAGLILFLAGATSLASAFSREWMGLVYWAFLTLGSIVCAVWLVRSKPWE